jgi:hypothetical protein
MKRASEAVTLHAGGIARATVVGNADGGCTRSEDPALSCLLRRDPSSLKLRRDTRAAVTPVPLAVWLSPPQRFAPVVPRVAHGTCLKPSSAPTPPVVSLSRPQFTCVPGDPCRHAVGGTPPQDGTCTAPTLGAGWCRVNPTASGFHGVERPSSPRLRRDNSLDFFESLTGSPQALSAADTIMARRAIRPHAVRRRASGFALRASP